MRIAQYQDRRWWLPECTGTELAELAIRAARDVDDATLDRQQWILDAYCLYGDRSTGAQYGLEAYSGGGITRNVIASAVDAVLSEVTQTRPRPMFVTVGGTWLEQHRARKLTYYCDAKFAAAGVLELASQATRDAIIAGLGILRPYRDPATDEVAIERIFPGHFLVDDRTVVDVAPRTFYVRHIVDRWHLRDLYPDHAAAIDAAPAPRQTQWYADAYRATDAVEVIEAIHLASKRDENDGRQCLVIEGAVLSDCPCDDVEPPFAFVRAVMPVRGLWGESLVHRAASTQTELNKLLRRIQDSMHLHARPLIFLPRQAGVVKNHLQNDVGTIVEYDGARPPTYYTPQSMPSDVYQYVETLKGEIYTLMGVSELSASSLKPRGLDSGRALQVYNDVQSRRFIALERDYERLHVRLAQLVVHAERRIADEDPSHEVVFSDKRSGQREVMPWRDMDLDVQHYRAQVFPSSAFPTDPAAKIQMLEGMLAQGVIDQQGFYELALDVPDLEAVRNRVVAPIELVHQRLDTMLERGEYLGPEPYMDLALGMRECALTLQRAELQGAPEERLELLRQWLDDAQSLLERAAAPAAPTPGAAAMAPEMGGAPPEMTPEDMAMMAAMPPEMMS